MQVFFLFIRIVNKLQNIVFPNYFTLIAKLKFILHNIQYKKGLFVDGKIILSPTNGKIQIGKNFKLISRKKANLVGLNGPAIFQTIKKGFIIIGDNCGFSSPILSSRIGIKIGNNVLLGGNVRIYDHDYHSLDHKYRKRGVNEHSHIKVAQILIEDDVFIGTNSIILKGVRIGARSIIGAGSVVSLKNIPPDTIVGGNPAKILKSSN